MVAAIRVLTLETYGLEYAPLGGHSRRGYFSQRSTHSWPKFLIYDCAVAFAFVKSGGRFSKNAVKTSLTSAERTRVLNSSTSSLMACSICSRCELFNS